jgi:hypothetical protein
MGARAYNHYTGTCTQPDPIPGADANAYGYANGDPVNEPILVAIRAGRRIRKLRRRLRQRRPRKRSSAR